MRVKVQHYIKIERKKHPNDIRLNNLYFTDDKLDNFSKCNLISINNNNSITGYYSKNGPYLTSTIIEAEGYQIKDNFTNRLIKKKLNRAVTQTCTGLNQDCSSR